jgi:UPF0755 protein
MVAKPGKKKPRPAGRRSAIGRTLVYVAGILFVLFLLAAYFISATLFRDNVNTHGQDEAVVYISTGANFEDVREILYSLDLIRHKKSFEWLARRKGYPAAVKSGKYVIRGGMGNNALINMLRSGAQVPVMVTFNNIRTKNQLAGRIASQIEADSAEIARLLDNQEYLEQFGLDPENALAIFIPDTYEFWWNTGADEFIRRMHREHKLFWAGARRQKADMSGLKVMEVVILASIIEKETRMNDEKSRIAGVYINRLRRGWPLQADPTIVYATGDFALKRVLKVHTLIESPYNTYKYKGLPPGPICIPSIASVDAVLNFESHAYMYFCARADLTGYHVFATSLAQHNANAAAYHSAISRRKPS